jgi:predicted GNAT family acetyltransferase
MTTSPDTGPRRAVTLDEAGHRYVITVDGQRAGFAAFVDDGDQRVFTHTEIGNAYAGQGLGGILISGALDDVRTRGRRVVPICPFVRSYLGRHHEYGDLVDEPSPKLRARLSS